MITEKVKTKESSVPDENYMKTKNKDAWNLLTKEEIKEEEVLNEAQKGN